MMTPMIIKYNETKLFQKDLKKLLKKYRTLEEDLETAKRNAIELYHVRHIDNQSIVPIQGFSMTSGQVFKIKKFACKALRGRGAKSGIRIIYAFYAKDCRVDFIEIYFKGEKANEDRESIKAYLKDFSSSLNNVR